MLVPVSCHTNLDDFRGLRWPKLMYNPQVGQYVEAECGRYLKIVRITHVQLSSERRLTNEYPNGVYLSIELHR